MKELRIIAESIYEVTDMDVRNKSRARALVDAKALFYHLAEELFGNEPTLFAEFTGQDRTTAIFYANSSHLDYYDFTWKEKVKEIKDLMYDRLRSAGKQRLTIKVNDRSRTLEFCSKKDLQTQVWSAYNEMIKKEEKAGLNDLNDPLDKTGINY